MLPEHYLHVEAVRHTTTPFTTLPVPGATNATANARDTGGGWTTTPLLGIIFMSETVERDTVEHYRYREYTNTRRTHEDTGGTTDSHFAI
jgi:hypothetical protein